MNPVLLKPSADTYSQVIVLGKLDPEISALPWMERKARFWPLVCSLAQPGCTITIRSSSKARAARPRSTLRDGDIVNMAVALECQADVYLVADIDRGGALCPSAGHLDCLAPEERALIKGFVLNKFRGDQALLGNAMDWLQERTGIPTVAIVPMIRHTLCPRKTPCITAPRPCSGQINIALIVYPYASNLDEFDPLIYERGVSVVPMRDRRHLRAIHAIILPGSKNTAESLRYLRETGLGAADCPRQR